jgi:hypothetical protein
MSPRAGGGATHFPGFFAAVALNDTREGRQGRCNKHPVTTTLRPEDRRVAAHVPSIVCSDSANRQDEPTKVFVNVGEHRTRLVAMTLFSEPREARRRDTAKLLAP